MSVEMEEVPGTSLFFEKTSYKLGGYGKMGFLKTSPKHCETNDLSSHPSLAGDLYPELKHKVQSQSNLSIGSNQEIPSDGDAWKSGGAQLEITHGGKRHLCDEDVQVTRETLLSSGSFGQGMLLSKSEILDEETTRPRAYSDSRTGAGRVGFPEERYDLERRREDPSKIHNRKKYLLTSEVEGRSDGGWRFDHLGLNQFQGSSCTDENPLAAMLQKYAVSSAGDKFSSLSPLKPSNALQASMFPQRGTPEKRQFHQQMMSTSPVTSFGLVPPAVPSSTGMEMNASSQHDLFCCHICSFMGISEEDFRLHMANHFEFQCPQCTYSSRTEGRLKRHVRDFHSDVVEVDQNAGAGSPQNPKANQPKRFKCRQCKFISYSREEHWTHNRSHIKEEKQLQCPRCPFVTEFKHHLEYHIRNHVGSKPFKCSKCNYSCVNKSMLNSHMKSHTNVYQFRCANCKYATKYSHSLKLHLLKKKHMPAVVLNPDGSLPMDGSGSFDLVSKRGPPRGPRGPRRSKHPVESVSPPPALLPIFSLDSGAKMSYSQGNDYSWVQSPGKSMSGGVTMSVGLPPPVSVSLFPQARPMVSQSLPYPLSMLNHLSSTVAPSLVNSLYHLDRVPPPSGSPSYRCSFCPDSYLSMSHLAQHVKTEHADKLSGFGIKLESKSPPSLDHSIEDGDRHHLIDRPTAANHPESVVECPPALHSKSAVKSRDQREEARKNPLERKESTAEFPLDLSARQLGEEKKPNRKRNPDEIEDNDSFHHSSTASPSSAGSLAFVSRKRSRKGKACKLDVISLKLQDRWVEESPMAEEDEDSSFDSDFHPGLGSDSNNEMERPFAEMGCAPLSPKNWNSDGGWKHKKQAALLSCKAVTAEGDGDKTEEDHRRRNGDDMDQEPINDSLSNDSKASESFATTRACVERTAPNPADKGYFMCQHCEMGFRDCVTYTLHMGYHGYNDPFQCNMCGHRSEDAVGFFVHIARVAHE